MNEVMVRPEFAVFVVVLVIESIKALLLGAATAFNRGKIGKYLNQEDADWLGGDAVVNDDPGPGRLFRAHRNTLENLVPFLVLGMVYLAVGANSTIGIVYFAGFLLSRLAHTYAYLNRRPMMRRNAYTTGWIIQLAMAIHVLVQVIGDNF